MGCRTGTEEEKKRGREQGRMAEQERGLETKERETGSRRREQTEEERWREANK